MLLSAPGVGAPPRKILLLACVVATALDVAACKTRGTLPFTALSRSCFDVLLLQQFLRENGLRLVIRSHEGPDARYDRDDMPPMTPGYSIDHITEGVTNFGSWCQEAHRMNKKLV